MLIKCLILVKIWIIYIVQLSFRHNNNINAFIMINNQAHKIQSAKIILVHPKSDLIFDVKLLIFQIYHLPFKQR